MKKLAGLYVITDAQLITEPEFSQTVEYALQGGARIVQYRDKSDDREKQLRQAQALRALCDQYEKILIINDDIELAIETNADGVHLGMHDMSLTDARVQLGRNKIIGVSCYNDFSLAITAQQQGADYIAFGSFFPSPTKPEARKADIELLTKAQQQLQIPVCAIGGITSENAATLIHAGADMLAIISDIFAHTNTRAASQKISQQFA